MSGENDTQDELPIEAITLRVSGTLLEEIDATSQARGFISRSEFLRYAIRTIIYDYPKQGTDIKLPDDENADNEAEDALVDRVLDIEHLLMEESVWCQCYSMNVLSRRFDSQQTANRIGRESRLFLESFAPGEPIDPASYFSYLDTVVELQNQLLVEIDEASGGPIERIETTIIELNDAFAEADRDNVLPVARAQLKACSLFRCVFPPPEIE